MRVIVINRADRSHRLLRTLAELRVVDFAHHVHRIEACMPAEAWEKRYTHLHPDAYQNICAGGARLGTKVLPSKGAFACAMSHVSAWHIIAEGGDRWAMVVEDDVRFVEPDFRLAQAVAEDMMQQSADAPRCVVFGCKVASHVHSAFDRRVLLEATGSDFTGLHCYMLNSTGARFLYGATPQRLYYQIDIYLARLAGRRRRGSRENDEADFRCYTTQGGAYQYLHDSDVQPMDGYSARKHEAMGELLRSLHNQQLPARVQSLIRMFVMRKEDDAGKANDYYGIGDYEGYYEAAFNTGETEDGIPCLW